MIAVLRVKPLRNLFAVAVILIYPLVALYPFDWSAPRRVANTATAVPDGGLRFAAPGPGIARTPAAPDWVVEAIRTHRLEVEVQARPTLLEQSGFLCLFTLEPDPSDEHNHNITIGQDGGQLAVSIRRPGSPDAPTANADTGATDEDTVLAVAAAGVLANDSDPDTSDALTVTAFDALSAKGAAVRVSPVDGSYSFRVPGVFAADVWVDIRVAIEPGLLQVDVDGQRRLDASLPQTPLENWDPSYRLTLGNAPTYDGSWFGDITRAVVRTGDIDIDYARSGALHMPEFVWVIHQEPNLTLFGNLFFTDVAINLLGFIPIGLLLGVWARARRWHGAWIAVCSVALVSGTLELLQFGIPDRYPSVNDLVFNTAGGGLGILLGWWLAGSSRAKPVT